MLISKRLDIEIFPRLTQRGDDVWLNAYAGYELLEVERIHDLDPHIPDRLGTQPQQESQAPTTVFA